MPEKPNPHAKHRHRVRQEFLANGFTDGTPPHKIVEMLLFYSIPRGDTNEIAHGLLNRFGNISAILDASPEELKRVKGIGDNSAVMLNLLGHICRRYQNDKIAKKFRPVTLNEIGYWLQNKHFGLTEEYFSVTSLNSKSEVIAFDMIAHGDRVSVGVSSRSVVETAIERKAASVIIAHNHPSGNALPSVEDIDMTVRISSALAYINIPLLDHVIIIDDDHVSLGQSAAYKKLFGKTAQDISY